MNQLIKKYGFEVGISLLLAAMFALAIAMILTIQTTVAPAPVHHIGEPYGGCDEAARYPGTPGYEWCKNHDQL